jgi:hypothetical protein
MTHDHPALRRTTRTAVAAALLLTLAGCGSGADENATDEGGSSTGSTSTPGERSTTRLTLPAGIDGRCMAPNVRVLRGQEVAFEGTATGVADGRVTLEVSRWYRGDEADTVVVEAPAEGMVELGFGTDFEEGRTYLVSATDGEVTLCGFTGERTGRLARLFEQAYAG